MGRTKELFGQMREQGMDIDCNGNLYEEWLMEEPNLGSEHLKHTTNKKNKL